MVNKVKSKNIIVVVNTLYEANKIYNSLQLYNDRSYLFPMDDFLTCEALAASSDLQYNRIATLNSILERFQVTKEDLEAYNDISNITVGLKIIIPTTIDEKV